MFQRTHMAHPKETFETIPPSFLLTETMPSSGGGGGGGGGGDGGDGGGGGSVLSLLGR